MKVVLQRVTKATITIDNATTKNIDKGLVILLGVCESDTLEDAKLLAKKCSELRIFNDENDKLNLSANDLNLDCLIVSNFTLYADTKKGRRPSFIKAAKEPLSIDAYNLFIEESKKYNYKNVVSGKFGADMQINLINDGPVTIVMDTNDWK